MRIAIGDGMERLLIIHRGALGDCILALPVIHTIQHHHPSAHLTLMGTPSIIKLLIHKDSPYQIVDDFSMKF